MPQADKQLNIQILFEIAMAIGNSGKLEKMLKDTLMIYLRKLNCSAGAVLQFHQNEQGICYYKSVLTIPYKSKFNHEFEKVYSLIPNKTLATQVDNFIKILPHEKTFDDDVHFYLMLLPEFGLLCLKKSGAKLSNEMVQSLRQINEKLAQACIACVKNNELNKAKEKAEESDRLKTTFIENISHEIRTPLNAIMGYSSLIAEKQIPDNMLPPACRSIVTSSEKLLRLIEDLLEVSMLESGNLHIKYNLCNINQLLLDQEDVFYNHVRKEQKENLNMKVLTPQDELFIVSDNDRLNQIFDALISNAVRFTDEGGIEIGYQPLNLTDNNPKETLVFYVKDSGSGIAQNMHANIFKPFQRIEDTSDKLYSGTGIGLTLCRHLATLLNGHIWLESETGKGSTFYFSIPAIRELEQLTQTL